jgi:hypothetical protein
VASFDKVVEATITAFVYEEAHRLQHGPQQAPSRSWWLLLVAHVVDRRKQLTTMADRERPINDGENCCWYTVCSISFCCCGAITIVVDNKSRHNCHSHRDLDFIQICMTTNQMFSNMASYDLARLLERRRFLSGKSFHRIAKITKFS